MAYTLSKELKNDGNNCNQNAKMYSWLLFG